VAYQPPAVATDILMHYTREAMELAGYTNIVAPDSRVYHNGVGNIHCGTNARRTIPAYNWWEMDQ